MTRYPRLLACAFLICVPVLLLGGLGAYFLFDKVPELVSAEDARVTRLYKVMADRLARHFGARDFELDSVPAGYRRRGSKIWGGTGWGTADASQVEVKGGESEDDGDVLVLVERKNGKIIGIRTESVEEREFGSLYWVIPSVYALMLVLTGFCVYIFYSFAKERDDFIHATVHDLRTPVAALGVLTAGSAGADLKLVAERMRRMVQNLTDFLNLGGKRPAPKRERVDLVALYREAYGLFKNDYEDDFAPVAVEGEEALEVTADSDLVLQIYWNLLGNDLKYAAPYGPVKVRFSRQAGRALVEFLDEGRGMTPRQMKRAFDRYYRAKTVLESGKGGFGIGLCTSREFARSMGGDLTVRANSPRGCVFSLTLPRQAESAANRAENMI